VWFTGWQRTVSVRTELWCDSQAGSAQCLSALNCGVISAANCLTATTRTARAADHVTLTFRNTTMRYSSRRVISWPPRNVGHLSLDTTSLFIWQLSLVTSVVILAVGWVGYISIISEPTGSDTTFIESNNGPLFWVQIVFHLHCTDLSLGDSHTVSFFQAINRTVCNGVTSGVVIGFIHGGEVFR